MNQYNHYGHYIVGLLNDTFEEKDEEAIFLKIVNAIKNSNYQDFKYFIVPSFLTALFNTIRAENYENIWLPRIFEAIIVERPDDVNAIWEQLNELGKYNRSETTEKAENYLKNLIKTTAQESVLLPRQIREIDSQPALLNRRISETIGSYVHPEYFRNIANRSIMPIRMLRNANKPGLSERYIAEHIGSFNNTLDIPVFTPPRQRRSPKRTRSKSPRKSRSRSPRR